MSTTTTWTVEEIGSASWPWHTSSCDPHQSTTFSFFCTTTTKTSPPVSKKQQQQFEHSNEPIATKLQLNTKLMRATHPKLLTTYYCYAISSPAQIKKVKGVAKQEKVRKSKSIENKVEIRVDSISNNSTLRFQNMWFFLNRDKQQQLINHALCKRKLTTNPSSWLHKHSTQNHVASIRLELIQRLNVFQEAY